jgi:adenylylsulfate kinase
MRNIFNADYTIWMNTIKSGRFEDTNRIFETPGYADLVIEKFLSDEEIETVAKKIIEVQNV